MYLALQHKCHDQLETPELESEVLIRSASTRHRMFCVNFDSTSFLSFCWYKFCIHLQGSKFAFCLRCTISRHFNQTNFPDMPLT